MCCSVNCCNLLFCHIPSSHRHIWCFRNIVFNSGKRTLGPRITNEKLKHWGLMLISYGCKSEGFQQSLWNHPSEILVSDSGSKLYRPVIFTVRPEILPFHWENLLQNVFKRPSHKYHKCWGSDKVQQKGFSSSYVCTKQCKIPVQPDEAQVFDLQFAAQKIEFDHK